MEALLAVGLIEKSHVQHAGGVHCPHLYQRASAGNPVAGGGSGDHGLAAGGLAHRQFRDGIDDAAVLVPAGKEGDQIPQGVYPQLFQGFGPCLANALDIPHIGVQLRHIPTSLCRHVMVLFMDYTSFCRGIQSKRNKSGWRNSVCKKACGMPDVMIP